MTFAEIGIDLDRRSQTIGQRLHGLNRTGVRTGDDCRHVMAFEQVGDTLCLPTAGIGQPTHLVGGVLRVCVTNEKEPARQLFHPLDGDGRLHRVGDETGVMRLIVHGGECRRVRRGA